MGIREIAELLRCPACGGPLENHLDEGGMDCPKCRLRYAVQGNILNMLPAQALSLEEKDE
jgi:uncharacterized protein YbaR (Trm112 family)